jgi:hypothetical protein
MNSVGSPMRKPELTSASSSEAQAPGTRSVTLPPPLAPAAAAAAATALRNDISSRPAAGPIRSPRR